MGHFLQTILDKGDPRMAKWPLMDNPNITVILIILYLSFVKLVGPLYMKNRKPFSLRYPMIVYNLIMVVVSAWIFIMLGRYGWFTKYNWKCEPIVYSYKKDPMRVVEVCWVFYITKFIEFADTIFFILRKKENQITQLHVIHHGLVPLTSWFGIRFGASGYTTIFAFLNSFVHIWMYLYYGLSAFGPQVQKYLWWKKYLTMLQMIQFCIVFGFMIRLIFDPACEISAPLLILNVGQAILFFVLFLNFYHGSYLRKKAMRKNGAAQSKEVSGESHNILNGNDDVRLRRKIQNSS
ncbi:elongation of very long chain fatty acids protein 7-like [Uloborus diversus]|uniref:elongation of very long chain fatty acids protein 7-like n=1 Tax=Uloborus diversus TaxID=327109 RepID=UPI00240A6466|nr:elongation of very long chain fatty acids protein 7-like [Uloborus diversus]